MKTVESNKINTCSGASIVELLVSLVIGSLVMTGAYTLWLNHQKQVTNLERKTELRNHMILASKRIQGSITNAGFGLPGIRAINVNLDTLTTFVNMRGDTNCTIQNNISKNSISIFVSTPSMFIVGSYLVVSDVLSGEVHKVISKNGNQLI